MTPDWFEDPRDTEQWWHTYWAGMTDPQIADREHDQRLAEQDRLAERAPHHQMHLAYIERPSDRERRETFDENRVRALLRPRTGDVSPSPRDCPLDRAA